MVAAGDSGDGRGSRFLIDGRTRRRSCVAGLRRRGRCRFRRRGRTRLRCQLRVVALAPAPGRHAQRFRRPVPTRRSNSRPMVVGDARGACFARRLAGAFAAAMGVDGRAGDTGVDLVDRTPGRRTRGLAGTAALPSVGSSKLAAGAQSPVLGSGEPQERRRLRARRRRRIRRAIVGHRGRRVLRNRVGRRTLREAAATLQRQRPARRAARRDPGPSVYPLHRCRRAMQPTPAPAARNRRSASRCRARLAHQPSACVRRRGKPGARRPRRVRWPARRPARHARSDRGARVGGQRPSVP